jgi:hypothetical protein
MNKRSKTLLNLVLGFFTCIVLVNLSTPSVAHQGVQDLMTARPSTEFRTLEHQSALQPGTASIDRLASQGITPNEVSSHPIATQITAQQLLHLQTAESQIAQADAMSGSLLQRYVAVLSGREVAPKSVETSALGTAGAVLSGDRLIVRGDFSGLTSELRDYATDPLDPPNPNVTSAIHIHRGEPTANGPFQYALQVQLGEDQLSGRFQGEYTLTNEQLEALSNGGLYVDLHTQKNRAGELRGILKPYTN